MTLLCLVMTSILSNNFTKLSNPLPLVFLVPNVPILLDKFELIKFVDTERET